MNTELLRAQSAFPDLALLFTDFINQNFEEPCVIIQNPKDNSLLIDVFGRPIEIKFVFVFESGVQPHGKVSAIVKEITTQGIEIEKTVYCVWFDRLGNIKKEYDSTFAGESIKDENALHTFVLSMLDELLMLNYFKVI